MYLTLNIATSSRDKPEVVKTQLREESGPDFKYRTLRAA